MRFARSKDFLKKIKKAVLELKRLRCGFGVFCIKKLRKKREKFAYIKKKQYFCRRNYYF